MTCKIEVSVCRHQRVGFAQTERIVYAGNSESFVRIPDCIKYCMDCGQVLE